MSLCLSILCTKVLFILITQAKLRDTFERFHLNRFGPLISNLLFVDDLIIFGKANEMNARKTLECLRKYPGWLGMKINHNKSSIFITKNYQQCTL